MRGKVIPYKSVAIALIKRPWFFPMMIILLFIAVFGATYAPWGADAAPAWVQAVGSVAAIIAAWLIPQLHDHHREKKNREDVIASIHWVAVMGKNNLQALIGVIERSEVGYLKFWKSTSSGADFKILLDAANAVPLTTFSGSDISYVINLRQALSFGDECAEVLRNWTDGEAPLLAGAFPKINNLTHHAHQIDWVLEQLAGMADAAGRITKASTHA
ncbi:hypothetical protein [Phytopseudomonas seleniipraecipitans]|uniref:Uncharacterized protein n=1 Tax=Phytopseudomonas seleniipraecipitans TaxID=640205 RepID=A0A1G7JES6_9GAMM|nr:hypothetical protein [Pseudomonas seleniipraecipitans]SDF23447.1 hypothetical protein SAMN05216381_1097 [Pseudomonas seleniipraecipitans]